MQVRLTSLPTMVSMANMEKYTLQIYSMQSQCRYPSGSPPCFIETYPGAYYFNEDIDI
jgi:hypothetical protein